MIKDGLPSAINTARVCIFLIILFTFLITSLMKNFIKGSMVAAAMLMGASSFAQIQDERNVTITMELVPILQLNMNTTDQVNFVFDEIGEYIGGITKYGGTILTASSTVSWDLFASGTSGAHGAVAGDRIWDAQVAYGTAPIVTGTNIGARNDLPLTALELKQFPADINANTATAPQADYGAAFTIASQSPGAFNNNVYVSTGSPYVVPGSLTVPNRYIAGGFGLTHFVEGGSYLTQTGGVAANGSAAAYYYVIDYRIVPGLPAIFPFAHDGTASEALAAGSYAKPGVYTMNVKYLMIENQ